MAKCIFYLKQNFTLKTTKQFYYWYVARVVFIKVRLLLIGVF